MIEDNLKRAFTILHGQCTESILAKLYGDSNYKSNECNQDVIRMLKLIKVVMFKLYGKNELTHMIWEDYVSVLRCKQKKSRQTKSSLSASRNQ